MNYKFFIYRIYTLLGVCAAGFLLGLAYWYIIPHKFSAIAVVRLINVEGTTSAAVPLGLGDVIMLETFLSSPESAKKIAEEVGDPDLEKYIWSYIAGGKGQLTLKQIPNSPLVQIRISGGTNKEKVIAATNKAADIVTRKNSELLHLTLQNIEEEKEEIKKQFKSITILSERNIHNKIKNDQKNPSVDSVISILLESNGIALQNTMLAMRTSLIRLTNNAILFRESRPVVFVPAMPEAQIISSPIMTGAIGSICMVSFYTLIILANIKARVD
jgi:hypothetical protein